METQFLELPPPRRGKVRRAQSMEAPAIQDPKRTGASR